MARWLFGNKKLLKSTVTFYRLDSQEQILVIFLIYIRLFSGNKMHFKIYVPSAKGWQFSSTSLRNNKITHTYLGDNSRSQALEIPAILASCNGSVVPGRQVFWASVWPVPNVVHATSLILAGGFVHGNRKTSLFLWWQVVQFRHPAPMVFVSSKKICHQVVIWHEGMGPPG